MRPGVRPQAAFLYLLRPCAGLRAVPGGEFG
jgi:hypothetical protein